MNPTGEEALFALADSAGVNCLISVIFAEGRRVNKSFRPEAQLVAITVVAERECY